MRMKTQLFFGALAYSLSLLSTEVQAGTPACTSLKERSAERHEIVVFSEDFDQKSRIPDSEYWSFIPAGAPVWQKHMSGSVREASVKKGKLILRARKKDGIYRCGGIWSLGKIAFGPGHRIEVGARFGRLAPGAWPAIWLMPEKPIYPGWPACGEIDIMEMGEQSGMAAGDSEKQVNTAIHYGPSAAAHEQQYYKANVANSLQDGNYHTYSLDWDENNLTISIDNVKFHTFDISSNTYFHDNFYILFNLAVGGAFTGITDINKLTGLKDGQKVNMYIDWVKIL